MNKFMIEILIKNLIPNMAVNRPGDDCPHPLALWRVMRDGRTIRNLNGILSSSTFSDFSFFKFQTN